MQNAENKKIMKGTIFFSTELLMTTRKKRLNEANSMIVNKLPKMILMLSERLFVLSKTLVTASVAKE